MARPRIVLPDRVRSPCSQRWPRLDASFLRRHTPSVQRRSRMHILTPGSGWKEVKAGPSCNVEALVDIMVVEEIGSQEAARSR